MDSKLTRAFRALDGAFGHTLVQNSADTHIPGVRFFRATHSVPRSPLLYSAGLVIIGQGAKIGYFKGRTIPCDPANYVVIGVPVPFECETFATPSRPQYGVFVDIDVSILRDVLHRLRGRLPAAGTTQEPVPLASAPIDGPLLDATVRLLHCCSDPQDSRVLGRSRVDEVLYRVLTGSCADTLYGLLDQQRPYAKIAGALELMHTNYAGTTSVEGFARDAGMSVSAFHRVFKQVTGDSPAQYVKKIRLEKAHGLIAVKGVRVSDAAREVGYASVAHFSREFKKYFKRAPSSARPRD